MPMPPHSRQRARATTCTIASPRTEDGDAGPGNEFGGHCLLTIHYGSEDRRGKEDEVSAHREDQKSLKSLEAKNNIKSNRPGHDANIARSTHSASH